MKLTDFRDLVAGKFHENWRKTRLKEDGTFEPRWKAVKDADFINHLNMNNLPSNIRVNDGKVEIDIANTKYSGLSADWQAENKAAAEVVCTMLVDNKPRTVDQIGEVIHNAWLERNTWAKGGELDVPFVKLPKDEQQKDLDQYVVAVDLQNELNAKKEVISTPNDGGRSL